MKVTLEFASRTTILALLIYPHRIHLSIIPMIMNFRSAQKLLHMKIPSHFHLLLLSVLLLLHLILHQILYSFSTFTGQCSFNSTSFTCPIVTSCSEYANLFRSSLSLSSNSTAISCSQIFYLQQF